MARGMTMAFVVLSLGLLAAPGFAAQGPASGQGASTERPVKDPGPTATGEGTDTWLTLKTKLALLGDERVSSNNVSVTAAKSVITLRGQVAVWPSGRPPRTSPARLRGKSRWSIN